ncbi:MAG: hypothetical protein MMC23_002103 [Stictis urceolatum]|nr:hypothetical protein [Stictis urceolata]
MGLAQQDCQWTSKEGSRRRNCYQGTLHPYYIAVQSPDDIKAAFDFAQQSKLPLPVKDSGHDYKGRNAVTFGAEQNFDNVFKFAEANNVTAIGGSSRTVGPAGGWISGAGHSPLSPTLGLGVDNVLELKVALPTGDYITTSHCQSPDIFYALRGCGGGTFGVITDMTTMAHPRVSLEIVLFSFISVDADPIKKFLEAFIEQQRSGPAKDGADIEPGAISNYTAGLVLLTPKLSHDEAIASMKPLAGLASSLGFLPPLVFSSPSFYDAFTKFLLRSEERVDIGVAAGSRLIFRANSTTPAALGDYKNDRAVTPAREMRCGTQSRFHRLRIMLKWKMDARRLGSRTRQRSMRSIAPRSGMYQNEADVFESDPITSFWGQS